MKQVDARFGWDWPVRLIVNGEQHTSGPVGNKSSDNGSGDTTIMYERCPYGRAARTMPPAPPAATLNCSAASRVACSVGDDQATFAIKAKTVARRKAGCGTTASSEPEYYVYSGHRYCWYDAGWHSGGWYW